MTIKWGLPFLVCAGAWAQSMVLTPTCNTVATTCTSSAITEPVRQFGTYPWYFSEPPSQQTIAITNGGGGTLTWTAAITGGLTTACSFGGTCIKLTGQYDGISTLSGTAPSVVKINFNGDFSPTPTPGTYTAAITFTPNVGSPQVETISIVVQAPTALQETDTPFMGYPVGCSASTGNSYNGQCSVSNEGTLALPAVNSSQTDANFGGSYKRCTARGISTEYGSTTAFSKNGTYFYGADALGNIYIVTTATCAVFASLGGSHGNVAFISMSGTDDQVYWYFTGATIHKYNFVTNTDTLIGTFSGAPYGFTQLGAGGTAQTSNDDWISVMEYGGSGTKICAVNLVQIAIDLAPNVNNTYCGSVSPTYQTSIDWTGIWGMDTVVSKRFVIAQGASTGTLFYVGTAGSGLLQPWVTGPAFPGYNSNDDAYPFSAPPQAHGYNDQFAHTAQFIDSHGNATLCGLIDEINGSNTYMAFWNVNTGQKFLRLIEETGGLRYSQGMNGWDLQPGAADGIGCVIAPFDHAGVAATQVLAITAANPAVLTTTIPHGYANGTHSIRIDGPLGGTFPTCLSATVFPTAVVTDSTHITVTGANCIGAGTYTANSANQGDAAVSIPSSDPVNRSEVLLIQPGVSVRQLMMHRSIGWNDITGTSPLISYNSTTTRSSISRDGTMVALNSNWGAALEPAVFIVQTGATPTAPTITTTCPLPVGSLGVAYSTAITATGTATITFSKTAGTLPTGLTLATSGVLSGTPSAAGVFVFDITATNGIMPDAVLSNCHLTVSSPPGGGQTFKGFTLNGIASH